PDTRGDAFITPRLGLRALTPPPAAPATRKRYRRSGEGEEQLLHLLLAHRGLPAAGQALPHPAGHDLETRAVQGPGHRRQLGDHLGAVPPVLDHRDDPGKLAMGAAEPVEHGALGALVDLHQSAFPVGPTIPGGVSGNAAVTTPTRWCLAACWSRRGPPG